MTRPRLSLFSLCVLVLSLMAFSATSAQATTGSKWLILNKAGQLKTGSELSADLRAFAETTFVLHSEILEIKVLFLCAGVTLEFAKLLANGSIGFAPGEVNSSKVAFNGCTTYLENSPASECTPIDSLGGTGSIISKYGHGLLVLGFAGEDLIKLLPDEGKTLATIKLPASCPIGTSVPVIGNLYLKDCENLALTHLVRHLVEAGPGTQLFTISETPEHAATLLGSAWVELFTGHFELKWSGDQA